MSPFSLAGRRALVTGANGGIGQAVAWALGEAGAAVTCAARGDCDETLAQLPAGDAVRLDLSDPMAARGLFDGGGYDILVNNAGVIHRADAAELTEAGWDSVVDVNLKAAFFTAQAFGRALLARGGSGAVLNIASLLSFQGGVRVASYAASKHGIAGITRAMANEWAGRGINVNAIAPGYIETRNTRALRDDPERSDAILARIPAGRWGVPADIGGAAVFLCSPAAAYVHGVVLAVDGGWLAR
jgi:2-deoxy-D-gluconate 3-dehydrogenase